jgi:hypothetical protein
MLGAAAVPFDALNCPVMAACPSLGKLLVISAPTSVKLLFTSADAIVVPELKLLVTLNVPDPFLGITRPPYCLLRGSPCG